MQGTVVNLVLCGPCGIVINVKVCSHVMVSLVRS